MKYSKGAVYACSILSTAPLCKASSLHKIRDGVLALVFSLDHAPSCLHLVLSSRVDPPFSSYFQICATLSRYLTK